MRVINLNGYIDEEVWYGDEITPDILHDQLFAEGEDHSLPVRIILNSYGGSCNAAVRMFDDVRAYPGDVHIIVSGMVFERNPGVSFHDLRQRYLFGHQISGNPAVIEANIGLLFPIPNVSFDLLKKTRNRDLHWIVWPSVLLEKSELLTGKLEEAFFGTSGRADKENYLLIKYADREHFTLYQFANTCGEYAPKLCELSELESMAYDITMNLYRSIRLNAELFSDPRFGYKSQDGQTLKDQVAVVFETAQKGFCSYCSAQSEEFQMIRWFAAYTPKPLNVMMWRWFKLDGAGPETPIEDLELTLRCYNCLKKAGLNTLGDLIQLHLEDYMKVKNLGKKSLMELEGKLEALGYPIKSDQ